MSQKKIAVVFEATGLQGGSVARALVRSGEYNVRGVTRDTGGHNAQDLEKAGVDLVTWDLSNRKDLQLLLSGAHVCFVSTVTNFDDPNCLETEIAQGCLIAQFCKSEKIQHVVFSSQLHSNNVCSIMARHLVAKAEIEQYMREIGLPLTCLIVPVYYEDFLDIFKPRTLDGRNYDIEIPMGTLPLDMMSVEDVGAIVVTVFRHKDMHMNKTLSVCGDKLTIKEVAQILSKYLRPKVFRDKQLTANDFHQRRSGDLKGCLDWANMFQFFRRVDQRYNLFLSQQMNPSLRSFEEWVRDTVSRLNTAL